MTVNEYITMDLLLPLAGGLAGAALYHLGAAFFRYIFDVEAYDPKNVMHLDGWAREDLMKADAVANVRLDALEERMGKVEEPIDAKEAWFRDATQRMARNTCIGSVGHGSYAGIGRMTYQQWREFVEAHGTPCDDDERTIPYILTTGVPYSSGCPCPKPTKDLRPGDEVSVKAIVHMVGENEVDLAYLDAHSAATGPMRRHLVTLTYDEFDAMRTDNK